MKWTVEIDIDNSWIADGFELEADNLRDAINESLLGYARPEEIKVKILKAPSKINILKLQGEQV